MSSFQVKGQISNIGAVEVVSEKFSKRMFTVAIQNGTFTDTIAMQFANDKCKLLDGIVDGSEVTVDFNIKSREYGGKWYTNCDAWKIQSSVVANQPVQQQSAPVTGGTGSDLPF